jgi:hypothetical protein
MKTWILCVNRKGASIHMRGPEATRMSSVDLFYRKEDYVSFLASEVDRLFEECGKSDHLFICAETSVLTAVLNGLRKKSRSRVSGAISLDLQSAPNDYVYKYAREMIEKAAS